MICFALRLVSFITLGLQNNDDSNLPGRVQREKADHQVLRSNERVNGIHFLLCYSDFHLKMRFYFLTPCLTLTNFMCSFRFISEFPDDGFYRNALNLIRIRVFSSATVILPQKNCLKNSLEICVRLFKVL